MTFKSAYAPRAIAIRKILKSLGNARDGLEPGPYRNGLGKSDWIAVESFKRDSARYLERLEQFGIPFQTLPDPDTTIVYVQFRDLDQAVKLLDSFASRRQPLVRSQKASWRRRFQATVVFICSLLAIVFCPIGLGAIVTWVWLIHIPDTATELLSSLVWIGILAMLFVPYIGCSYWLGSKFPNPRRA